MKIGDLASVTKLNRSESVDFPEIELGMIGKVVNVFEGVICLYFEKFNIEYDFNNDQITLVEESEKPKLESLAIVVSQQKGVISTNFEDIKVALSAQMQIYKELEVTEANKPERKKDVATLRKMDKAITSKCSEVRNEFLKPYDEFKKLADELKEIINEPIGIIDNQVKEFEEAQRIAKIEVIKALFVELISVHTIEMQDEVGLATIYDNRWENATSTMKSVKEEMTIKLNGIRDNVALINSMVSEKTADALAQYWCDFDVNTAMGVITRYEAQKREIEQKMIEQQRKDKEAEEERQRISRDRELEREKQKVRDEEMARIRKEEQIREEERQKAAADEERIREEERQRAQAEQEAKAQAELEAMQIKKQADVSNVVNVAYFIEGTPEELAQVEMYMDSIGVAYEKL